MKKLSVVVVALCGALVGGWALAEVRGEDDEPAEAERGEDEAAPAEADEAAPAEADDGDNEADDGDNEATDDDNARPAGEMPEDVAGFTAAMSGSITSVGGEPTCDEAAGRCVYTPRGGGRQIHLWYSEQSRTIYVFAPWLAVAGQRDDATPTVLRHLMAINRMLDVARFEWNPQSGEVRFSTVQNVDSNLDRAALVGLLRVVEEGAARYGTIITRLLETPDRAPDPPAPPAQDEPSAVRDPHDYMNLVETELTEMGLRPTCDDGRARCTYELDSEAARNVFSMVVQLDPETSTLRVSADRYLSAPTDSPRSNALLQRLLELNWEQLVPMFQWDARSGHVRLTGVVNTDTNFDRRAFRGVVQSLHATAERHYRTLRTVLNP